MHTWTLSSCGEASSGIPSSAVRRLGAVQGQRWACPRPPAVPCHCAPTPSTGQTPTDRCRSPQHTTGDRTYSTTQSTRNVDASAYMYLPNQMPLADFHMFPYVSIWVITLVQPPPQLQHPPLQWCACTTHRACRVKLCASVEVGYQRLLQVLCVF